MNLKPIDMAKDSDARYAVAAIFTNCSDSD
jgi:hypothetical protein